MRGRGGEQPPDDLAVFYADQYDRVRGALALFTGDRRLAEDLAQEAFVKTCQHWEKIRAMDAPGAWVHRVGINLAISRGRRRRTEVRVVQRVGAERRRVADGPNHDVADEALTTALAALPDDERAVLVLRYYVDLSLGPGGRRGRGGGRPDARRSVGRAAGASAVVGGWSRGSRRWPSLRPSWWAGSPSVGNRTVARTSSPAPVPACPPRRRCALRPRRPICR